VSEDVILAIDQGTTNTKAVLVSGDGLPRHWGSSGGYQGGHDHQRVR